MVQVERWEIPTPFPVGPVNAYYVGGKAAGLVDPGPGIPDAWNELKRRLEGKRVRRVLVTHHHVDHVGLAARVQREFGAELLAHRLEAAILDHWGQRKQEREADYAEGLARAGVPDEHRERMRYGGRKIETYIEAPRVDVRLEEGDRVRLGDAEWTVLHTPGHTEGSLLLRGPGSQATLTGDTLLGRITPNALSVRLSERGALPTYLSTLRRVATLDLGEILPGHGAPFADAPQVIGRGLRHAELRQQRLFQLVAQAAGSAYDLTRRLFPRLADDQLFLAVSETLGHLDVLRQAGRVDVRLRRGVDAYEARTPV